MGPVEIAVQPVRSGGRFRPGRRAAALGVLALAAMVVAVVAGGSSPLDGLLGAPARPSRIAIVDVSGRLSTIATDGSERRDYPLPGLTAQFPAWSPDGRSVAAIAMSATDGEMVVVHDRAAGAPPAPSVLYRSDASLIYLAWAPGGSRIGLLTGEPDSLSLRVVATDSTTGATVATRGQPLYWDWIDGAHLFVHSGGDAGDAFLGEVGIDGVRWAPVTSSVGPFQSPAVSSDGRYRAYVKGGPVGAPSVVVEGLTGVVHHEAAVEGPSALAWNPRRDELAYTAPSRADLQLGPLRVLDAGTGRDRELLAGLVVAYAWAPDGRTVAAIRLVEPSGPNSASGTSGAAQAYAVTPRALTVSATASAGELGGRLPARDAAVSASGLVLDFVDGASGATRSELPVTLPDVIVNQLLPFFDQYSRSHRLWSPASDAIVLPLVDASGASHVTIIGADGTAPRAVADGVEAFWSP